MSHTPVSREAFLNNENLVRLWADRPEYVELLKSSRVLTRQPTIASRVEPEYPPVIIPRDATATVWLSVVVDAAGGVAAARVIHSTDKRFNDAALAGVRSWTFHPGATDVGPVITFVAIPMVFPGGSLGSSPFHAQVLPVSLVPNLRDGTTSPELKVILTGPGTEATRAGRLIINHAEDDAGTAINAPQTEPFLKAAVGSTSRADFVHQNDIVMEAWLQPVPRTTRELRNIDATIELVVPALDPDATATVELSPSNLGRRVESAPLRLAGVELEVFTQPSYDARLRQEHDGKDGLTEYGIGAAFLPPRPPAAAKQEREFFDRFIRDAANPPLTKDDIALGITDPGAHLVGYEFVSADGRPLTYNRNGWAHHGGREGKRFDVFRIEGGIPAGAKLECWLLTPKSRVMIPLKLPRVPVVESKPPAPPAPTH